MMNKTLIAHHELFIQMSTSDKNVPWCSFTDVSGQKTFFDNLKNFPFFIFYKANIRPEKSNTEQLSFLVANNVVFTIQVFPKAKARKAARKREQAKAPESFEEGFSLQDDTCLTTGVASCQRLRLWTPSVRRFASHTLKKADGTEDWGETLCAELWCPPGFVPWRAKERGLLAEAMSEVQRTVSGDRGSGAVL